MNRYYISGLLLVIACVSQAAQIKDTESVTHGYDAASYQIVDTYEFIGFKLIQINLPVLSHYSYFLVSDNKVLVVDPGRDIDFYVNLINKQSLSVVGVFLTHSPADFVAGHMEMVKAFNCPVYQNAKSGAKYKIEAIEDGTVLQVGQAKVQFIDTHGHVLDGTSAFVFSPGKTEPELILTGDYLFVGGVGRPELVDWQQPMQQTSATAELSDSSKFYVADIRDSKDFVTGHIPGAINRPYTEDIVKINDVQIFKPVEELQKAYAQIIPVRETKVIVYCRTGHQASQMFFVLVRLLGYKDVLWYDTGWSEWAAKQELPVENSK